MKSIEELVKENQVNTLLGCIKQSKDEHSKSKKIHVLKIQINYN